jgi:uncharacterized protein (TIGR02271 family)
VEKGFFFPTDYYIPMSAIASAGNGQVYLTVTKDAALHSGWDTVPAENAATMTDVDWRATDGDVPQAGWTDQDRVLASGVEDRIATDEELRIPVMEEELTATVRPQEAGTVRIAKDVVAEDRVLEVPVTEERVRIERRAVDRPVTAADDLAFQEAVIDVPVQRETVDVQKHARVKEEVIVGKEAVQRTQRVADTVRREEVYVDEDAVVDPTLIEGTTEGRSGRPL